jgi:hypothetical protein
MVLPSSFATSSMPPPGRTMTALEMWLAWIPKMTKGTPCLIRAVNAALEMSMSMSRLPDIMAALAGGPPAMNCFQSAITE